jgi:hypothetical protein
MANPGKALASDSEDDEDRVEDVPESGKEVDRDEPAAKKVRGWGDGDETDDDMNDLKKKCILKQDGFRFANFDDDDD